MPIKDSKMKLYNVMVAKVGEREQKLHMGSLENEIIPFHNYSCKAEIVLLFIYSIISSTPPTLVNTFQQTLIYLILYLCTCYKYDAGILLVSV